MGDDLIPADNNKAGITSLLLVWGSNNYRKFSWRKYTDPYSILVAELLLRRTTASAVERIYIDFLSKYPNLRSLAGADKSDLECLLKTIGYNKQRAVIAIEVATKMLEDYGEIPCDFESLIKIPHVGHYTAGAILSIGCGKRAVMVDSNVKRIIKRVFASSLPDKIKDEYFREIVEKLLPIDHSNIFNLALLDFGAIICRYDNPKHESCPIRAFCDYYKGIPFRSTSCSNL